MEKLNKIGLLKTTFIQNDKEKIVLRYYISSKELTAAQLIFYARNQWKVESMHWLLDVNLKEDLTKLSKQRDQESLNILRKISLNSMKLYKQTNKLKDAISGLMQDCLMDPELLFTLNN